jgi:hypothetical protein
VPGYAVVDDSSVEAVEELLGDGSDDLQELLDRGYRDLDRQQPVLGQWLAEEVSSRRDELVQSLGYFLSVTVFLAFREAFPRRLGTVDPGTLEIALETLAADEELRAEDPTEVLDSDDVVAMGQPAIVGFVQHHVQQALEQADEDVDLHDLDRVYRAVLIEVIALSHAVSSPTGRADPELLA